MMSLAINTIEIRQKMNIFPVFKNSDGVTHIIAGLGNPGEKYKNTRHNAGFIMLDFLSSVYNAAFRSGNFRSEYLITEIANKKVLLLKPQTYMNLSGESLADAMNFYKISSENVIIILDDINFPVGRVRIRKNGTHGGHNGMKNIFQMCGTSEFARIKIGAGIKPENFPLDRWVVSNFQPAELAVISRVFPYVQKACEMILNGKIIQAMSDFNGLNLC